MFGKYENINYMIVTQDPVCNPYLASPGERNGKFSQNGKFGQNGMSGQKGKVHLSPNVSSSAHYRGCVVNGSAWCYGSNMSIIIIESVDSISRDERGFPLTQYITNGRISRDRYTITHFKHHHRVLRLIFNRMSV